MTVADNTSRNQYTATSGQTVFAYTFEIVDKGDIVVLQDGITLSEGTDYTVSGVGSDSGGNITLTTGASDGDVMTIYRDMAYVRTQNYTNSGDFLASEINSDFDNLWLAGEQVKRSFSQSVRKPITDADSVSMELPVANTRKNKFLKFDEAGAVSVVTSVPRTVNGFAHINDFINPADGSTVSDSDALTSACLEAETIYFGGTTMDIDADWSFPTGGKARRWMLEGNTWNLTNNAKILIDVDDFVIIGDGATVDGNWKIAKVDGETAATPQTITVESGHNFVVGDHVSCSFSNLYLPNSSSRIGGANPLSEFNTVTAVTDTTITLEYSVDDTDTVSSTSNTLPGGAELINARFDKYGIGFTGSNSFHIEGVNFQNMPNAYAIYCRDSNETVRANFIDCEIDGCALDMMTFQGDYLYMKNVKARDARDIAKQVLVWANETKTGRLYAEGCDWAHNNRDAFLYSTLSTTDDKAYQPDMTWVNCVFDGRNTRSFTPRQLDDSESLFWQSRGGASHMIAGTATFINCDFFNIQRGILGTTSTGIEVFTQDKMTFQNCNMDAIGLLVASTGISRRNIEPLTYQNCNVRASEYILHRGGSEVYFQNCVIQERGASNIDYFKTGSEQTETSATTTRVYHEGEYVINNGSGLVYEATPGSSNSFVTTIGDLLTGDKFTEVARLFYTEATSTTTRAYKNGEYVRLATNNKFYRCVAGGSVQYEAASGSFLGDTALFDWNETSVRKGHFENTRLIGAFDFPTDSNCIFDNLRLPYRNGERVPMFENRNQHGIDNKLILEGLSNTDSTRFDFENFFNINTGSTDTPPFKAKIEDSDVIMMIGGGTSSQKEWHFILQSSRFNPDDGNTAPNTIRGAFAVDPEENSIVESRQEQGDRKRITVTKSLDINAAAAAAATTVVVTNIDGSETFDVGDWISFNNDGDVDVYFREVTAVSGSDPYTLTLASGLTEAITTDTNSFLIKHEYLFPVRRDGAFYVDDKLGVATDSPNTALEVNGVTTFSGGTVGELTTITSSSNAATLDLRDGDNFLHDLTENVTYTFSNPAASGSVSAFTLKVIQGATARTITWPTSVDWAGGTAPTLSTGDDDVDVFVFFTHDGGTTYYGFTAGQDMS